jgi:hypothetical protein
MKRALKGLFTLLAVAGVLVLVVAYVFRPDFQRASFQKNLKKRVAPAELQAWAMEFLKEHERDDLRVENNKVTNLPPVFHGLFRNPPFAFWFPASAEDTAFIKIVYGGGGFGHFGLEIGPTNRPTPRSFESERRYTPWAPGVCFFDGQ